MSPVLNNARREHLYTERSSYFSAHLNINSFLKLPFVSCSIFTECLCFWAIKYLLSIWEMGQQGVANPLKLFPASQGQGGSMTRRQRLGIRWQVGCSSELHRSRMNADVLTENFCTQRTQSVDSWGPGPVWVSSGVPDGSWQKGLVQSAG